MATTNTVQPGSSHSRVEHYSAMDDSTFGRMNGWAMFAGSLMVLAGIFQFFQGLAAVLNSNLFFATSNYVYSVDITTWGWVHLGLGVLVALAGFGVFSGALWARTIGIVLALLSATVNFFFIPYYPIWSIIIIVLDIGMIWGLANFSRRYDAVT